MFFRGVACHCMCLTVELAVTSDQHPLAAHTLRSLAEYVVGPPARSVSSAARPARVTRMRSSSLALVVSV